MFPQNEKTAIITESTLKRLSQDNVVETTVIISTLLLLFFAIVLIIAILKYRNKQQELLDREDSIKNELVKAILESKEETMETISEKIHIKLQQTLSLAKLNINKILLKPDTIDVLKVYDVKKLITDAITEVKHLSKDLDSKYITGHTLEENITQQLRRVKDKTNINTEFITSLDEISLDKKTQVLVYRIIQEAINNSLNHAEAKHIKVQLKNNPNDFDVYIEDDGIGFDTHHIFNNRAKKGIGLTSMKHRTQLINGTFKIDSKIHNGTKITLNIPLNDDQRL